MASDHLNVRVLIACDKYQDVVVRKKAYLCTGVAALWHYTHGLLCEIPYLLGISTIGGQASKLSQSETKHPEKE